MVIVPGAARRLFISYSHPDRPYVMMLAEYLKRAGFDVWFDHQGIGAGDAFSAVIQEQIGFCDALVVVVTPAAARSGLVHRELALAEKQGKPIFPLRLIPAEFLPVEDLTHEDVGGGKMPGATFMQSLHRGAPPGQAARSRLSKVRARRLVLTAVGAAPDPTGIAPDKGQPAATPSICEVML